MWKVILTFLEHKSHMNGKLRMHNPRYEGLIFWARWAGGGYLNSKLFLPKQIFGGGEI